MTGSAEMERANAKMTALEVLLEMSGAAIMPTAKGTRKAPIAIFMAAGKFDFKCFRLSSTPATNRNPWAHKLKSASFPGRFKELGPRINPIAI